MTLERFDRSMGAPFLLGILFFFVVCLGISDTIRMTAMVVAVFTLFVITARFGVLRDRLYLPFIALTLVVIIDGVSTFYAVSGKFALREFLKVFLAYLLAVILLATSPKKEETSGKRIAAILAVCTAFGSLVSIDMISTRWISGTVTWILGRFTDSYDDIAIEYPIDRITSIFSNANVFGGFSGIGLLLSLGLSELAEEKKERCCGLVLLYINALAFVLAYNRGAFVFLLIAFVAFALMKAKGERLNVILMIIEVFVLAGISAAVIAKVSFRQWNGAQPIPLLCIAVGAALLCLADLTVTRKVVARLSGHGKATIIVVAGIVALLLAFSIAAISITSGITLDSGESITRIMFLQPGSYPFDLQADGGAIDARIVSYSREGLLLSTSDKLYTGEAREASSIEVPEDSMYVSFKFTASEKVRMDSASCGGRSIPLRYVLLPSFIVNRLQSRSLLKNSLQRLVYFEDGLKLFRRSPVVGLGIGAFENAIKGVQSYYYETKYAHNHYFQTMLETGIIGLLLFLGLLVSSAAAILKSRKTHPYAPVLGAALVFMAGQALHDIIFSSYGYLPIAYGTFAMINLSCGEKLAVPKLTKTVRIVSLGIISACTVVFCGFLAGNMMAKRQVETSPTLQTLVQAVKLDKFEWADYALPYVVNATGENINPNVRKQADIFAERLAKVNSNTIPIFLAEYYFTSDRTELGIEMIEKYVDYVSSDSSAWQKAFDLLRAYADGSETFRSGVARIAQKMETWNAENIGTVKVNKTARAFIAEYTS